MRLLFTFFIAMGGILGQAGAQTSHKITGTVSNGQKPVEAASITLLKTKDSSVVKAAFTDLSGRFELTTPKDGKFLISVQTLGFARYYSEAFELGAGETTHVIKPVQLQPVSKELAAVTVTTARPFIEQKLDKTIINVDASPSNAGLSVLELLEKSPGIALDKDGNISFKGKAGVMILIDGKPSYLSGDDLTNLLKNMPASNLDQIELMSNPPAKYDASGNAGVINIRTKKLKTFGYNGNVAVGGGQGVYPRAYGNTTMNYRDGKFNLFGNFSYFWNKNGRELDLNRNFRDINTDQILSIFDQVNHAASESGSNNYKFGMDYYASKKTTIGFVVNGSYSPNRESTSNVTNIEDNQGNLQTRTLATSSNNNSWNNFGANINLQQLIDTKGQDITADLDYIHYNRNSDQLFNNYFYDNAGGKIQPDEFIRGRQPATINIYSIKADYEHPLKGNARFEAGFKSSYVQTDNNALYDSLRNGVWQTDFSRTNHFLYDENINAAYVNMNKQFSKKWSGQLGLRLENTISKGNQLTSSVTFNRDYTQLFPTAYLGFTPNDKNQFSLSYGRRINRPDYADLNPFFNFLDKYTYQVGNPFLEPQISHNVELSHIFHGFLTTSLSYSQVNDIILDVISQVDSTHTSFVKKQNVAKMEGFNLSVNASLPLSKTWRANVYLQGNHSTFSGLVNGGYLSVEGSSFSTNMSTQLDVKGGWTFELNGFYRSKAVQGTLVSNDLKQLNFAASKQLMKKKATLRINFRDFLNLQHFSGSSRYQNVDLTIHNPFDNRLVNVSFTYRFSKGKASTPPKRKVGGSDDEQSRVKSGN